MIAPESNELCKCGIICCDSSSFATGTEVFPRIEAEGPSYAERTCFAALVLRAMRLARVFNHWNTAAIGDLKDGVHIRNLPVEIDGNDSASPGRYGRFEQRRIHREG